MTTEVKPLVLSEELARMVREASPYSWFSDAHAAVSAWCEVMPGAKDRKLSSVLSDDGKRFEIMSDDGWTQVRGMALYTVEQGACVFYPNQRLPMPGEKLNNEQEFIGHLLEVLRTLLRV